jgi:UDP-2,3-diacylglucosamine hydrolase
MILDSIPAKKIFFISDFHLGADASLTSAEREKKIIKWLISVENQIEELYLVGDVFDYWFEYKHVIPKGFTRLIGTLVHMRDKGIPIYFFTGNHDMWVFQYFEKELGIPTLREPIIKTLKGKKFFIGHGDGLGPGDTGYKLLKRIFSNRFCQWAFGVLHPNAGLALMRFFSQKSRKYTGDEAPFTDPAQEWLALYCEDQIKSKDIDYFVFGHRHLPIYHQLSNGKSVYINLGEWMYACSYGEWDGKEFKIKFFESEFNMIYGT